MADSPTMLIASTAASVLTLLVYWAVTPRGWGLRTKIENRAKAFDAAIGIGMLVLWGVLCAAFLRLELGERYEPGPPSPAELLPYDLPRR